MSEKFDLNALRNAAPINKIESTPKTKDEQIAELQAKIMHLEAKVLGPDNREEFQALPRDEQQAIVDAANEGQAVEERYASVEEYLAGMDSDRELNEIRLVVTKQELEALLQE